MSEPVSGRLPSHLVRSLDELGEATGRTRSQVLRLAVERGLAELRLERALTAYRENRASLGRAAEIAGVHLTVFIDALRGAGIPFQYSTDELDEDMAWAQRS